MSASSRKPWTKFIKRAIVQGGGRGKEGKPSFRGEAAYVGRLRRLEKIILSLTMKVAMPPKVLDKLLQDMLDIVHVEPPAGSGSANDRDGLPLPHSGPADGQAERDPETSG